jgi:uncharacterized protein YpmS
VWGRNDQAGRGGLGLIVLIGVLAVGGWLAWGFVHQSSSMPVVATSRASDASAQQKVAAFAIAQARAQQSGRAVSVAETFDDAELSSLANDAAQSRGLPVTNISLHSTSQGTVEGRAQAQVAGQSVPVTLEGVPVVSDGRVALDVRSTQVGSLPGPISDQLTQQLRQPLELGEPVTGFDQVHLSVTNGRVTVTGVAQPG